MPAGGLAQGERKLLDVAVAYALRPKLLFLDEPTSGVSTRDKTADHGHGVLGRARRDGDGGRDRARHGRRVPLLGSYRDDARRQISCRRHAGSRSRRTRTSPAFFSAHRCRLERRREDQVLLEVEAHQYLSRPRAHPARRVADGRRRRGRLAGRAQWRRAHDHHREHHRPAPRPLRRNSLPRPGHHPPAAAPARQMRHRLCAGEFRHLSRADGGREPHDQPLAVRARPRAAPAAVSTPRRRRSRYFRRSASSSTGPGSISAAARRRWCRSRAPWRWRPR